MNLLSLSTLQYMNNVSLNLFSILQQVLISFQILAHSKCQLKLQQLSTQLSCSSYMKSPSPLSSSHKLSHLLNLMNPPHNCHSKFSLAVNFETYDKCLRTSTHSQSNETCNILYAILKYTLLTIVIQLSNKIAELILS